MTPDLAHEELRKCGFVKLGKLVDTERVALLKQEAEKLLSRPSKPWSAYSEFVRDDRWNGELFAEAGQVSTFLDVIGQSSVIDELLEELLRREDLQLLLRRVLGLNYRIWYASVRRDEIGAKALRLHRDQPGEVGLSILVDNVPTCAGTTVFLKGSHRWPAIINYLPRIYPNRVRRFLSGVVGVAGDVHLFYNATWHGRIETDAIPRTALILTFLPESESVNRRPSQDVLNSLGPNLKSMLCPRQHIKVDRQSGVQIGPDQFVSKRHGGYSPLGIWMKTKIGLAKTALKNCLRHFRAYII